MKLTLKAAKILLKLTNGESIPASSAKGIIIDELVKENIIWKKGKHHKSLQLNDKTQLAVYLSNQLQISDLNKYIEALENIDTSRSEFVKITTDSKNSRERVFKGFLVNSYNTVKALLNNNEIIIKPQIGAFTFIYDFETFVVDENITIVGVENSRNYRHIQEQADLFEGIYPLFISRYPQNQNKDFIQWMNSIPNKYLHFGDFDIAGIGIYINEYKKHLGNRAEFLIPETIEQDLLENGNRSRYDIQRINFNVEDIEEQPLRKLVELIGRVKKGLDQEYYIK